MAVEYHVATFFYDGATTNRWVRDVGPRGRIRPQSVEEFMGIVSRSWANAEVISVTDRPDQQVHVHNNGSAIPAVPTVDQLRLDHVGD